MDDALNTKVGFTFYFKFNSHFYRHRKHSSDWPVYGIDVRCVYWFVYSKCLRIKIYSYHTYLTYLFEWDYINYKRNCARSEDHTSELQSHFDIACALLP